MDVRFEPGFSLQEALDMIYDDQNDKDNSPSIYICPPDVSADTDEDSAEEDGGGLVDNLTGRQLSAPVEMCWQKKTEGALDQNEDDITEETVIEEQITPTVANNVKRKKIEDRVWTNGDLENHTTFEEPSYLQFQDKSPLELFQLFFDDTVFMDILNESRKYALYKNYSDPEISLEELKCFFGILILSGYHSLPGRRYYWDQEEDMGVPMVKNAMRRNRFEQIMRFLHFADNTQIIPDDKIFKLRPLMEKLKSNFLKYFQPTEHLNYDESMIKYYGRHSCKQFIRGKPIRFGYKAWCLNSENSYLVNFQIYQGKQINNNKDYNADFGTATAPLVTMLDKLPIQNVSYQIFVDNLFTSFTLLTKLKQRGYGVTGTIRDNRIPKNCQVPDKKSMMKRERGSFEASISKNEGIMLVRWMDNAVVSVASTSYGVHPISAVKRYSQAKKKIIQVPRPCLIGEYNKYMGGTDRMDEDIGRYRLSIRGKKWYWPIFTWLVDVSLHNAWVLYRQSSPEKKGTPNIVFRREIAQMLLRKYGNPPSHPGRPSTNSNSLSLNRVSDELRYDHIDHFVVPVLNKKRRCAGEGCSSVGRTQCNKCNVGLCIECFLMFHIKK